MKKAFTLIELLVVLFLIGLLMGILLPSLRRAKQSVISLLSSVNQREVTQSLHLYAANSDSRYPGSVATIGLGERFAWQEPMVLAGYQKRSPNMNRSIAQYLNTYMEDAESLFCPGAPSEYQYAQAAWLAGDDWDNPEPDTAAEDPLFGTYCFYWNYVGYIAETHRPFVGPRSSAQGRRESRLLISEYFGYGHWRNELAYGTRQAYASCERMSGAGITPGTAVSCDFWSRRDDGQGVASDAFSVKLKAAFTDGHVETFTAADTIELRLSMTPDGMTPYPDNLSPGGIIYIPRDNQ